MSNSQIILHRGGHVVEEAELAGIATPEGTDTWFPKPHIEVLSSVKEALTGAGYQIARQSLSVSQEGMRFFGVLDLTAPLANGVTMAVGLRNSNDKSCPIGFVCGQRVFVCDNMAFTSEIVIAKRHTRHGEVRYLEAMAKAVSSLASYQQSAGAAIEAMQNWELTHDQANSLMLQAYESGLISSRLLPDLIEEWRKPSHDDFKPLTGWSLWNCFTEVLKRKQKAQPSQAALTTIRLQKLLMPPKSVSASGRVIDVVANEMDEMSVIQAS